MNSVVNTESGTPRRTASVASTDTKPSRRHFLFLAGVTVALAGAGMGYSIWWPALVRHHGFYWLTPPDLWSTVRSAHFVGWGGLSFVYTRHSGVGLITLPGFEVLLAPLVMLSSAIGLSESAPTVFLPKPEAWLLLGPVTMLVAGGCTLLATDTLAGRLGIGRAARKVMSLLVAAALFPTLGMWGHPEDALAFAAAIGCLILCLDSRWTGAGWMLGVALVLQLYVALLIPLMVGLIGWRASRAVMWRAVFLPACLLLAVIIPDHQALKILLKQPAFPKLNHPTPWLLLSPKLAAGVVAGGPARLVAAGASLVGGWLAYRWRQDLNRIVWLAAGVMAARCLFEAVVVPYYVMPVAALALLAAWRSASWRRLTAVAIAALALSVMPFSHAGMWAWWWELAGLCAAVLVFSRPSALSWAAVPAAPAEVGWLVPESLPAGTRNHPPVMAGTGS